LKGPIRILRDARGVLFFDKSDASGSGAERRQAVVRTARLLIADCAVRHRAAICNTAPI
jgi:hypothetical protein